MLFSLQTRLNISVENSSSDVSMANLQLEWIRVLGVMKKPAQFVINETTITDGIEYNEDNKVNDYK